MLAIIMTYLPPFLPNCLSLPINKIGNAKQSTQRIKQRTNEEDNHHSGIRIIPFVF
jgi:hypothetical protein